VVTGVNLGHLAAALRRSGAKADAAEQCVARVALAQGLAVTVDQARAACICAALALRLLARGVGGADFAVRAAGSVGQRDDTAP
jgi:hypothetical protein